MMLDASFGELGAGTGAALLLLVSALPWERVLWSEGVVVGIFSEGIADGFGNVFLWEGGNVFIDRRLWEGVYGKAVVGRLLLYGGIYSAGESCMPPTYWVRG